MKRIITEIDFEKFKDKSGVRSIPFLGASWTTDGKLHLFRDYVERWVQDLLLDKGIKPLVI